MHVCDSRGTFLRSDGSFLVVEKCSFCHRDNYGIGASTVFLKVFGPVVLDENNNKNIQKKELRYIQDLFYIL